MDSTNSEMAAFFDFGNAAMPETNQQAPPSAPVVSSCPAHPNEKHCLCHGFLGDFELATEELPDPSSKDDFNNDFSSWIPRYSKPDQACDYCRARQLECFFTFEGQSTCSPCNALFRTCSFEPTSKGQRPRNAIDTLHTVGEDVTHFSGGLTGIKTLKSLSLNNHSTIREEGSDRTPNKQGVRFPRAAVKVLKAWIEDHLDHPYPTDEDKEVLMARTGLSGGQIATWMANTRRRNKSRLRRRSSDSSGETGNAQGIDIPNSKTWDRMNPLERWKNSPPENEPAPLGAILRAVDEYDPPEEAVLPASAPRSLQFVDSSANSETSLETYLSGISAITRSTESNGSSLWSHGSRNSLGSRNSIGSRNSGGSSNDHRRRRRVPARLPKLEKNDKSRIFQCTFCTDTFKHKYDWARHEKTLHLSMEKWICAPLGPVITTSASGQRQCVYCDELDPSDDHLEKHNHSLCEEKGLEARTFYRKDHLRQHLRLVHNCKLTSTMELWKTESQMIKSRCGFCGECFTKWQDRVDHMAKEFRDGAHMKNWKGCRGLEAVVASQVTNAMPPYLIANDANSMSPFSATNRAKRAGNLAQNQSLEVASGPIWNNLTITDIAAQEGVSSGMPFCSSSTSPSSGTHPATMDDAHLPPNATCWEILTLRLGQFVRQALATGSVITDDVLQREGRRIIYDDEHDTWNQTAADNLEWLNLFKQAHGITPMLANFDAADALEDLGIPGHVDDYPIIAETWRKATRTRPAAMNMTCNDARIECLSSGDPLRSAFPPVQALPCTKTCNTLLLPTLPPTVSGSATQNDATAWDVFQMDLPEEGSLLESHPELFDVSPWDAGAMDLDLEFASLHYGS